MTTWTYTLSDAKGNTHKAGLDGSGMIQAANGMMLVNKTAPEKLFLYQADLATLDAPKLIRVWQRFDHYYTEAVFNRAGDATVKYTHVYAGHVIRRGKRRHVTSVR